MKTLSKLALISLICLAIAACGGNKKNRNLDDDDGKMNKRPDNNTPNVVDRTQETNTTPLARSFRINGKEYYDICCAPTDLDDSQSLLSQRVILFGYDQSTVESHYREIISIHARYLSQNPSAKIVLEGHADERGTPEYNLALGEKRAKSVANLMRAQGASVAQISVVSFGEEKPVSLCTNEGCWSQNRRVLIVYTAK